MAALRVAGAVILTYLVFGHVLALGALRVLGGRTNSDGAILLTCLGLAPGGTALLLYFALLIGPGRSRFVYIGAIAGVFLVITWLSRGAISSLGAVYRNLLSRGWRSWSLAQAISAALILMALSIVCFKGIFFPIEAHDALIHATYGRVLYEDRALDRYSEGLATDSGFRYSVEYPPGVHLLYAWGFLLQGSSRPDWWVRTVAPLYLALTLLLVWRWGEELRPGAGVLAALALAVIPVYSHEAAGNSIDAIRVFFFVACLYWTSRLAQQYSRGVAALCALSLALSVFTHILGLIALPVAGLLYLVLSFKKGWPRSLPTVAGLATLGAALGGFEYLHRYFVCGRTLGSVVLLKTMSVQQLLAARGLETTGKAILNGFLEIFLDYRMLGIVTWIALASVVLLWQRKLWNGRELAGPLLASGLTVMSVWLIPYAWSNYRYVMTATPLLAVSAGASLLAIDETARRLGCPGECRHRRRRRAHRMSASLVNAGRLTKMVACSLPVLSIIAGMIYIRVNNLMWAKTGDNATQYGIETVYLSDENKLVSTGVIGYFASVFYLNQETPSRARILVTEEAPFFYYGVRAGLSWMDVRMEDFYRSSNKEDAYRFLLSQGISYIQVSDRTRTLPLYRDSLLDAILADPSMAVLVWRYSGGGATGVYQLLAAR